MTRDEASKFLSSSSAHERLKAARCFAAQIEPSDLKFLQEARQRESVQYVKVALDIAISRARDQLTSEVSDGSQPDLMQNNELTDAVHTKAVKFLASQLLHEFSKPIGLLALAASQEVPNYSSSRTRTRVDALKRTFEALALLQTAATPPQPTQFDLADAIAEVCSSEKEKYDIEVSLDGRPLIVTTDKRLLELAICNGVRNALEAVADFSKPRKAHPVIVTWGETDIDYWVSIMDAGPGVPQGTQLFEFGSTAKEGHTGFGLAIARQAMQSIGGSVALNQSSTGGARFDVRWGR